MSAEEVLILNDALRDRWKRYTTMARETRVADWRSVCATSAATICEVAQELELKLNIEFDWLPR